MKVLDRVDIKNQEYDTLLYQLAGYHFMAKCLKRSDVVLDVGCGAGYTSVLLKKYCKEVVGIDTDKDIVTDNKLNRQKGITFYCYDAFDCVNLKQSFDVVICRDLIEHYREKQQIRLLKSLICVLKNEGLLLLGTPRRGVVERRKAQGHKNELSYNELNTLLNRFFHRVIIFSQTDEVISLVAYPGSAWRFIALCMGIKSRTPLRKQVVWKLRSGSNQ